MPSVIVIQSVPLFYNFAFISSANLNLQLKEFYWLPSMISLFDIFDKLISIIGYQFKYTYWLSNNMDDDFFGNSDVLVQQQQYSSFDNYPVQSQNSEDFQFSQPVNYSTLASNQVPSYSFVEVDNQALRKMQEQQLLIQEKLRQKSNQQYQLKRKRKQEGRRQYEQFVAIKQKQLLARKAENIDKQKSLLANNQKLSQEAGWRKVAANVPLKQGEHKGKKETNRMRESIINKRNDQLN